MPKTQTLQHSTVFHNKQLHSSCVWEQQCTTESENLEAPQLTLNPWIPIRANCKGPQQSPKHLVLFSNCCFNNSSWQLLLFFSFILDLRFDLVPFFRMGPSVLTTQNQQEQIYGTYSCKLFIISALLASIVPPSEHLKARQGFLWQGNMFL